MSSDNGHAAHRRNKKSRRSGYLRPAHVITRVTAIDAHNHIHNPPRRQGPFVSPAGPVFLYPKLDKRALGNRKGGGAC
jgi:hypothetical protein